MILLEIKSVVEVSCSDPSVLTNYARQVLLRQEVDNVLRDPIAYQEAHMTKIAVTGYFVEGPISSLVIEDATTSNLNAGSGPKTLEPVGFPGI